MIIINNYITLEYLKRKQKASSEGNRELLAVACSHLGDFYNQQGRFQDAVEEYQEAATIYTKMGKKLEMAKAHRMVGEMFMLLGEFDNAKEHINDYLSNISINLIYDIYITNFNVYF